MTETPPPSGPTTRRHEGDISGATFGAILVIVGGLFLAAQLLDFDIGRLGWPFIIVGIGAAILVIGLVTGRESGMVVGCTVTTTVGLLLAFQNATDLWATWAYAWALVGPAASGLGLALHGLRTGNATDVRNGTWGLLGGLALFGVGFLFFEGVIGLSGDRIPIPSWMLPAGVIAIGLVILVRALRSRSEDTAA